MLYEFRKSLVAGALASGLVVSALAAAGLTAGAAAAADAKVTFLLVNDIYKVDAPKARGGFARLAAIVKAEKAKGGRVLYVHAGDTISPSLMSGFDKGSHVIELLNFAPPDVFIPGNHEYDFGPDIFRKRMADLKSPLKMAANLRDETGKPLDGFEDMKIVDYDGVKVGLFGMTADDSKEKSQPGPLKFEPTVKSSLAAAKALREQGADFVVAMIHANRTVDMALYNSGAIDLILTGDDHDMMLLFNGKTAMVESKEEGEYVTAIDVAIKTEDRGGRRVTTWWPNFRIIDSATVDPDPETQAKVEGYLQELSRELDVEIGKTVVALDSRTQSVRTQETAIGNLIADGMRWATGADIAITNGGGIRGNKQYEAGKPFTRRDVLTELPFGNRTVLIEVTGEQVLAALENGVSQVEQVGGRFPQVSGLAFEYDKAKPALSRVVSVKANGEPLDPKKVYRLATNDFMMGGGDGYRAFAGAKPILAERDAKLMANDVMAFVREKGMETGKVEGRSVAR
jgi:2',3'-cyclic-nucleotide 2'-phosphodiesterase (5'-nucleotidase family)